jgi:hypothetical protein
MLCARCGQSLAGVWEGALGQGLGAGSGSREREEKDTEMGRQGDRETGRARCVLGVAACCVGATWRREESGEMPTRLDHFERRTWPASLKRLGEFRADDGGGAVGASGGILIALSRDSASAPSSSSAVSSSAYLRAIHSWHFNGAVWTRPVVVSNRRLGPEFQPGDRGRVAVGADGAWLGTGHLADRPAR